MSYGVPTAATTTGVPLSSTALTSWTCEGEPHALKVERTTRSFAFAAATAWSICVGEGLKPVSRTCGTEATRVQILSQGGRGRLAESRDQNLLAGVRREREQAGAVLQQA